MYNPFSTGQFAVIEDGELVRFAGADEAVALLRQPGQRLLLRVGGDSYDTDGQKPNPGA